MINSIKLTAFVICFSTFTIMANAAKQNTCPHLLTNSSMVVNIEGKFINEERNRTNMSIEWRHHNNTLDTFFVNLYDSPSFRFITSGSYRYMEIGENKIKRQLGLSKKISARLPSSSMTLNFWRTAISSVPIPQSKNRRTMYWQRRTP